MALRVGRPTVTAVALWLLGCPASGMEQLLCPVGNTSACLKQHAEEAAAKGAYYWAMQKGGPSRTGFSPFTVPFDLSKGPAWRWTDPHNDVVRATPLIDHKMNIYLTTVAGRVYKWDKDGQLVWSYNANAPLKPVSALYKGKMYIQVKGDIIALDMETGRSQWRAHISTMDTLDSSCLFAFNDTLVFASYMPRPLLAEHIAAAGATEVVAVSTDDGSFKWKFTPDVSVYNFQASTSGDGTICFQDRAGGLYRLALDDGRLIWRSGMTTLETFTTGAAVTDSGRVYVVSNMVSDSQNSGGAPGVLHAYRHSDGKLLWVKFTQHTANQAVAVGRTPSGRSFIVLGTGDNPQWPVALRYAKSGYPAWLAYTMHQISLRFPKWFSTPKPSAVAAYDAETGEQLWVLDLEPYRHPAVMGDNERVLDRYADVLSGKNPHNDNICLPDSCSQPVIGGDGTTYIGWQHGKVLAIRDANEDGRIEPHEVSAADIGEGFQGSLALAPGMLAAAPCGGGLFVYKG